MPSRPPTPTPAAQLTLGPGKVGSVEGGDAGQLSSSRATGHPLSWGTGGGRGANPLNTLGVPSAPHLLGWQSLLEPPGYQRGSEARRGGQDLVCVLGVQHG